MENAWLQRVQLKLSSLKVEGVEADAIVEEFNVCPSK